MGFEKRESISQELVSPLTGLYYDKIFLEKVDEIVKNI